MARQPRFCVPGVPQHVIQRGNNRGLIFDGDRDKRFYLETLTEMFAESECAVHAYVLMSNHVHLLVTPRSTTGLSKAMQCLGRRYVGYYNWRHQRTGGLWDGRFRASPIDTEEYLFTCMRYIELNPVRAKMAQLPRDYFWTSFHANARCAVDPVITPHALYLELGRNPDQRAASYSIMFDDEIPPETLDRIRRASNRCWVLGNDRFAAQMERAAGRPAKPKLNRWCPTPPVQVDERVVSDPTGSG